MAAAPPALSPLQRRRAVAPVDAHHSTGGRSRSQPFAEEESRFRALVQNSSDIISIYDPDGTVRYLSPSFERLLGLARHDWIDRSALDLVHPDDRVRLGLAFARLKREPGATGLIELRLRRADGAWRWFEAHGQNVLDDPAIGGLLVNARDVTPQREALAELRAAELRFRTLVEQIPAVTNIAEETADHQWRYHYISPQIGELFGYTPAEWVADPGLWEATIYPEDRERMRATDAQTSASGEPFRAEYRVVHRDGRVVWVRDSSRLIDGAAGRPSTWQGVLFDITELKETETALREAEAKYRTLIEQIPAVTYVASRLDSDPHRWRFDYVSPRLTALLGDTPDEWLADPSAWERRIHPDDRQRVLALDRQANESGEPVDVEYRFLARDGRIVWIHEAARLIPSAEAGLGSWQGILLDVTAEKNAEARYRTLVDQIPAITYTETVVPGKTEWRHTFVSPQVEALLGYTPAEWLADDALWGRIIHPEDRDRVLAEDAETESSGEPFSIEYRLLARDGRVVWIRDEAVVVRDEAGQDRYWHGIMLDVTERKVAEEALRQREAEFRLLFSRNPHPTWVYDRDTLAFLEVNDVAAAHYGYRRDEFLRMRTTDLLLSDDLPGESHESSLELRHRTKDGRLIDVDVTSHALIFRGRPAMLTIAQDVTARLSMEAQLAHQAFHDVLTGLPNRALFLDRLSHALARAMPVAVLFVDLDDFKVVNDTLGHTAGDALLIAVAKRLERCVRPGDTIARLGGDEFTVLLESGGEEAAVRVAQRLAESLTAPFWIEGHEMVVSPSVGIATGLPSVDHPDELLRRADVAMYEAKSAGKGRHIIFDESMDAGAWRRLALETELRRAIQHGQLRVYYQPLVALESGEITEIEALVRWQHPTRGLIPPDEFIPLAEETGLIVPLGQWVLEQACHEVAGWRRGGSVPLILGVNLSARQFQHPTLVGDIARVVRESGIAAACLKLEITETVAMSDIAGTVATLRELKELGVQLAIDDFGTGYSGLSYLQRCPIDTIKIDRSYIDGLGNDTGDTAMVRAVMAFAKTLGLSVTAEGVETEDQAIELRALGVDHGQGFFFAHPAPGEAIARLVEVLSADDLLSAVAD